MRELIFSNDLCSTDLLWDGGGRQFLVCCLMYTRLREKELASMPIEKDISKEPRSLVMTIDDALGNY